MNTLTIIVGLAAAWVLADLAILAWLFWMANRADRRRGPIA